MSTPPSGAPTGARIGPTRPDAAGREIFGKNVFSPAVQRQRLPKAVYQQLQATLEAGEQLDPRSPTSSRTR